MKEYVVGFAFGRVPYKLSEQVLLIEKLRPANQYGKYNGIGGKVEAKDRIKSYTPYWKLAMAREFAEETGITFDPEDWTRFAVVTTRTHRINYLYAFPQEFANARQVTDEKPKFVPLLEAGLNKTHMPDLRWLVPMAWQHSQMVDAEKFTYDIALV